jgi:hypothetical protein
MRRAPIADAIAEITAWRTTDGQQFKSQEDALRHEAETRLRMICREIGAGRDEDAAAEAERVLAQLLDRREELEEIFQVLNSHAR